MAKTKPRSRPKTSLPKGSAVRRNQRFSLQSLLIFVLVFAGIGGYIIYKSLAAGSGSTVCSVSPSSVQSLPYPQRYYYTVGITAASPNTDYFVWVYEPHNNQVVQQHPVGAINTDSTGTGSSPLNGNDPDHVLAPGTVSIKITNTVGGKRFATCSLQVI